MAGGGNAAISRAATLIKQAEALIITAGAGMGVDSGLPDFRGPEGLWRAYPPLRDKHLRLEEISTPSWFDRDPKFAWGFFGHRYNLYSSTEPHQGFQILRRWGDDMKHGCFVFTSNVDGHFQRAGFSEYSVVECHGSINYMQCCEPVLPEWNVTSKSGETESPSIWKVPDGVKYEIDMDSLNMTSPLPKGPPGNDDQLARPNILMFGDWKWCHERTSQQEERYQQFQRKLSSCKSKLVVIEIGAGNYVPTVRMTSEDLIDTHGADLIRINPRDSQIPHGHISLAMKGLEALKMIDELM